MPFCVINNSMEGINRLITILSMQQLQKSQLITQIDIDKLVKMNLKIIVIFENNIFYNSFT